MDIVLKIDSQVFQGWEKVSVSRTMEALAGSFSFDMVRSSPEAADAVQVGKSAQISIVDGQREAQILDGFIDTRKRNNDTSGIKISITGRDKTADLEDCSAIVTSSSWARVTLKKLCEDILAPFSLTVEDYTGGVDPLIGFTMQPGDTAHSLIETACRARGVLPLSDRWGNLTLVNSTGQTRADENLEYGRNLKNLSVDENNADRFSRYIVKGQADTGGSGWDATSIQFKGEAADKYVTRYRPLILNAEGKPTAASVKRRAAWEAQVRAGRAVSYSAQVQGWIQNPDAGISSAFMPWDINQVVNVRHPLYDINTDLLITGVEYTRDDSGTITNLTLNHPDTYRADPAGGFDSMPAAKGW